MFEITSIAVQKIKKKHGRSIEILGPVPLNNISLEVIPQKFWIIIEETTRKGHSKSLISNKCPRAPGKESESS